MEKTAFRGIITMPIVLNLLWKGAGFMFKIAVCEDAAEDLAHLRSELHKIKIPCDITEYTNAETLLFDVEEGYKQFDLFFLDIYLPGQNGVEAARRIRAKDENAVLIFLSVSEDFYREAFDVYAFHYLIKPIGQAALKEVLQKAEKNIQKQQKDRLQLSFRGQNIILTCKEIVYISSSNHTLCFHLHNGKEQTIYGKLDEIEIRLDSELFVRCHKSFMVNLLYVDKWTHEGFYVENTLIPISRSYAQNVKEIYHRRLFGIFQDN